jgi:SNF2 family DNA or RNA helicase
MRETIIAHGGEVWFDSKLIDLEIRDGKISAIKLEIAKLKDRRYSNNQKRRQVYLEKESLERKVELEREAALIQKNLEAKYAEAKELIENAPWKDVAFDWQIEGALKLPDRAILADKRGMGKTLSAIIWRKVHQSKKTLICLRKEVASDFIKELGIREPRLTVYPMLGVSPQEREFAAMLLNHHEEFVVVTNIESWRRDAEKVTSDILRIDYDGVILDEAHHIKNANTGTAQGFFLLAQKIPKVLELTGTPIKNKPQDMYSLLHALYPDLFPRESKFLFDYCVQVGQNRWIFTEAGLKTLVKRIESFYLARSPEDIGRKVPPPRIIEYKLDFEAHPEQKQAYKDMTERNLSVLGNGKVVPTVVQIAVMTRQAQIVSWPADIVFKIKDEYGEVVEEVTFDIHQSVKADWAEDLITELVDEGARVILFSRFKPAIYELKRRLDKAGLSVAVITGDEKAKGNTKEVLNDFDLKTAPANPKYQVLLATYQTVGESANLNAARHMLLYDRFWNPGNEDQAIGRADRINSVDQATIHIPYVENSIDEYMTQLIEDKRVIVNDFKEGAVMQANLVEHLKKTV